ncbi:MAG TPA: amino acid adenylation domain-containing protein, partial [Thermoanaerobaculia bacterium]|nr:amino acid adenylation domain-containing protein [Thermoanaerobaculia bacterium]
HLSWWRERLRGAPAALDLPADRPRPAVADRRGASSSRALPQRLWGAVESLARRAGATPFLVVLTALEALLARYSGADDLTVGTPAAGRTRRETEDLIGFFVNTLVLRAELAGAPSFQDLLLRARESMLGAHAHQDLPFERLVEELAPERELGRTPLFQVMLAFGNMPMPPLELPGLRLSLVESEARTSKFDLTVSFAPRQDGALLHLSYRTDLFERTTAERMADHLTVLLAEAVADPAARLSDLQLLTAAEREQLAHEAEEARRGAPAAPGTVPELFRDVAARVPEAEAVTGEGLSVTFRELAARCARLAGLLRRLGAGPEVPVALCAEPSSGLVAGLLAILQAGGVWVPLDPSHPDERLAWMLEDSGAPLLLVEESLAGRFTGARARRILLDGPEAGSPAPLALPAIPPEGAAYEGAAYVIYTSGSTGRPKGTVISHQSLAGYLTWFNERFAAVGARPMPAIASPGFDASLKQLLAPLLRGDPVWIVPPGTASRPDDLLGELARRDAVALNCVPSLWRILLDRIEAAPEAGRSLRHLLLGGEAFDTGLVERTLRALPGIEVWNLYGPTEATANASCARVSGGEAGIGRGIAGAALHAVDPHLQLLPAGVPGELAIAGPGLARGYLGLPALTAERFVPNPFAAAPGERLYRTGDRARWRPGLRVELLGRLDRQVKVRGFRVEPGEVEAVLATHPQVKEAAVIGLPQGPQEMRLAAYLAVGRSARPAPEDVRRFVAERLPAAMVPTAWVLLDRLPRTPAGKLDARALPEPDLRAGGEGGSTAPQRPAEELVAAIFADLLRVERVGAADGFFALGGHSLLATQVISRLRSVFDVELPLRTLFERPGVAELAAAVEEARRGGPGRAAPPLVPVARGGNLPLSFAQERLWFLDQLEPGSTAYNIPAAFTLSGSLDAQALTAAYGEILRRHEALRTTFTAVDGQPVQRISPPAAVSVAVIDLAGLPLEDRQAAAARLAADDARRGFDLARGPLVRLTLLRLGRDEHLAVLGMHHIVADAWSMRVLVRELTSLYTAFVTGAASPLPELPLQYADYAVWQRDWLRGEALEAELAFWREALAGAPGVLELPADRPRPPAPSGRGASRTVRLSPALTSALTAFSRREGLTLFMTLLAAWNALLFRASEQTDLVVGVPIANRNRLETEGLIGFFTNTLALRSRPAAGTGFLDLARAVRETALKAYSHQDLPFERLVEELAPERSLAHTPLFQVLFSLQNVPAGEIALPGLALAPWNLAQETAKFDLSLLLAEAGDELHATLELSADLFDAVTAHRLLERFRTALWGAVADPGRSLAELPLLPLSERHQILYEWNEAPAGEGPPCVHHLVAAQARRTPEAIAVLPAGGTELSYGDLDRLADRLARRLRELGVRPDDCVGVCLERSWEGVVALLAVLRAGGCYLPLDPAYPPERLGFMLADAAAPVIVTRDRLAAALPPHAARVLSLDAGWPEPARGGELPEVGPEHLAYAIYTSGSTGRPKGVALPHRTLANLIAWQIGASAAPAGRTLQFASASFDVSLQEILATWAAGGTLVLLAEEARSDAEALLCRLIDARVERLFLPFVALQQLAEAAASSAGALPPLKEVLTAGEQLQVTAEVRALFARLPGCVLRNQYGPSEAHVVTELALWNERPGAVEEWPALPPIGRPIAATEAHLLDPRGAPVPIGVPGEICLGGAGLARGYLGRPDQTAERFVPDPWGRGGRLYRTGDLARRRASGEIEFLGRIDHQVKIRGFRIELGEIEAALSTHPAAREAVVVARGEGAGRRLVAYIVPATEGHPGDLLRAHLLARLPDYMVPTAFVPVEALPLTASGKVDRKALAASGPEARGTAARGDAARTPTEELLAGIWAEVLGVERVGIHDGFFDLGGHSLLATRLVARLRGAFGVELPLRALFERPSVAELARLLDSLTRQSHGLAAPPLERVSGSLEPSLSFAQQSLWLIDQIEGGSATYNMLATLELAGRLDTAALAGSFEDVVERHAVLRTSFALRGGEPRQVIHSHLEVPLLLADLSALPASRREEALGAVHRQMRHPFDLAKAPLLRTVLLRLVPDLHVLALCQHHIVSDAWSIGILVREMAACYEARTRGARAALPPLPVQYADYADWQRRWLRGEALEKLLAFWHRQLGTEPPAARLPALRPAPAARTSRGGRRTFPLTAGLEPALRALARREGVTLFMLLLGAFQALLHRSTGQEDLVLVAAASRRDRLETEGLIGCFLNMLPLRASLTGDLSFRRLLKRVRETCLDAFAHQDMPFERLVAELRLHNQNGRSPFQVAFGMQSAPPPLPEIPALAVRLLESDSGAARLDLTLWVTEHPEGLSVSWTYSADLFDGEEMVRLHGLYEALLTAVAMNPDARLRDLALPAAPERESGPAPRQRWEDLKKRKLKEARERSVRG